VSRSELLAALEPVIVALEALGVRYYVTGSIASSAHGVARASVDADVVAELRPEHAGPLVAALSEAYYVPEARLRDAIARRASCNVIHLETMLKVDVFVPRGRPFDDRALERSRPEPLEAEGGRRARLATAEDTILAKLEWYRRGGEVSERQWSDVLGILRVAGPALDEVYLSRGAAELGVEDLLDRARSEAPLS
jgi:hypothetical protein